MEQIRDAWDRIAPDFDEFATPLALPLGEDALRRAGLRPGMRFSDVAAGSGALSLPAARLGAQVVATDIAPTMVALLEARARDEGLANLRARVMDGQALELDDDSFDVSGSQNGVSLFPDLKRGLREMVRVTRPGGRVLVVAFGPPPTVEFLGFFLGALHAAVPGFTGLPLDPPPLPFQVADPDRLRREMVDAGLTDVGVETTTWRMEFRSAAHFWDMATSSNPIGAGLVADLTQEQITVAQQVIARRLRERSGPGSVAVLDAGVNIGIGTK
ncbi:MAG: methyltransferase domain-containing protein [Actinobacteria bacterium]|nr:methyltransferase domain-containing protein [Actinomycetota bacterium]